MKSARDGGVDEDGNRKRRRYYDNDRSTRGLCFDVCGKAKSWLFCYVSPTTKKRREWGLGSVSEVPLERARAKARAAREQIADKVDPLDAERATAAAEEAMGHAEAAKASNTLRAAVTKFHAAEIEGTFKEKHAAQWLRSIEAHVPEKLLDKPIGEIEAEELLEALRPIYAEVPETGTRIRQRLELVFDDALFRKKVTTNPALAVKRRLKAKRVKGHHAALPFAEVPAFVEKLREAPGTAARALEFAILTAARTGEVLGMTWAEIAPDGKTWVVPASRMKAKEEHTVYLSDAARAVLDRVRGVSDQWVFYSADADGKLSNMAMLALLRRLGVADRTTVHGFRASFSSWAKETRAARMDAIEACLAHREKDRVAAAYNYMADFADERRELLGKWAAFAAPLAKGRKSADVLQMPKRRARKA